MRLLKATMIVVIAYFMASGTLRAEGWHELAVPADCLQLDRQLQEPGGLGVFLKHGVQDTKETSSQLDQIAACNKIEKTSDLVGGFLGIASYCDVQDMLKKGAAGSPLYKRLAAFLRLMSNDLHELAAKRGC